MATKTPDFDPANPNGLSPEELAKSRERFTAPPVFDTSGGNKVDTGGLEPGDDGFLEALARAAGFRLVVEGKVVVEGRTDDEGEDQGDDA